MDRHANISGQESSTPEATEGKFTRQVEQYTANVPSSAYLGLAIGSMILSASVAAFSSRKSMANFIGLWVPTIMLVGIYNKLVKMEKGWLSHLH